MGTEHTWTPRTAAELRQITERLKAVISGYDEAIELLAASRLPSAKLRNVVRAETATETLEKSAKKAIADVKKAISDNALASASKALAEKALNAEAKANNRSSKK